MRLEDWPKRLRDYIDSVTSRSFEFGVWDCCVFVDGAIEALTGERYLAETIQDYNRMSSVRFMDECGGFERAFRSTVNKFFNRIHSEYAQRGDVVLVFSSWQESFDFLAAGIIGMNGNPVVLGPNGLHYVGRREIVSAWAIR